MKTNAKTRFQNITLARATSMLLPYGATLIGYENLMDCPEILPEDSLGNKHKNRVGDLRFSKLISRNGLRRNTCRCIFGHQT